MGVNYIDIKDERLLRTINDGLGKSRDRLSERIIKEEIERLLGLDISHGSIKDVSGLEYN